jgi:protein-tyrosine phosphatase
MKILFVCLGNICRSPLAEAILAEKAKGVHLSIKVASAGFESFHRGDPADRRSVAVAKAHGIDLNGHTARMFTVRDFDHYDRIYVMDRTNYNDVMGVARDSSDEQKVDYIMNLVHPGENRAVPDPWYGRKEGFENVFRMLDEACDILIKELHHTT